MSMQRKTIILTVLLLCSVLFSGCSAKPKQQPPSTTEHSGEESVINEDSVTDEETVPDMDFDLEGWLAEGWLGPTAVGLACDKDGTCWRVSTWDGSVSYCLYFYLNGSGSYDGEVVLECFYKNESAVQANWQGRWRIETETEQSCRLYLDVMLTGGEDMASFEDATIVSESYLALVPRSGNNLLLVADDTCAMLPIFPEGVQAVELTFVDE